jgi:hypothetical protein
MVLNDSQAVHFWVDNYIKYLDPRFREDDKLLNNVTPAQAGVQRPNISHENLFKSCFIFQGTDFKSVP